MQEASKCRVSDPSNMARRLFAFVRESVEDVQRAEPQHVHVLQSISLLFHRVLANKKSSFGGVGLRGMITDHKPCGIKVAFILEANREITQCPSAFICFCKPFLMEELSDFMLSPPKMSRNGQGSYQE